MRFILTFLMVVCEVATIFAQRYHSLDATQIIDFKGDRFVYNNQEVKLGPKTFFLDGQLSDEQIKGQPYVFNSFQKAAEQFIDG